MGHEVIDAVKAARLISDFITHVSKSQSAESIVIGGLFEASQLSNESLIQDSSGLVLVPQIQSEESDLPFIFLTDKARSIAIFPKQIFTAPSLYSEIDMLSFVHRQRRRSDDYLVSENTSLENSNSLFLDKMSRVSIGTQSSYAVAETKKNNLLKSLLDIPKTQVLYVRYFFGLRKLNGNQLTIILCPVDITGRNILVLQDGTAAGWIELF